MFAFVLMPFDSKFDDIYKLGIKEIAEKLGITAERVDEQIFHKENILERIYSQINAADFIIADMTDRNPNVFYETGYAHAKNKICLLLTSNADDIPFDLKHHRHIVYGNSIQDLRRLLEADLRRIAADVANRQSIVTVEVAVNGLLEKTQFNAKANIDVDFDFNNKTTGPSPEIEAIYFYTGRGWQFQQDGQPCPSTISDLPDFHERHFVRSPLRRNTTIDYAEMFASFIGDFVDVTEACPQPEILDRDARKGYPPANAFADAVRIAGFYGIVYPSLRHPGGACLVALAPHAVQAVAQGRVLRLIWSGQAGPLVSEIQW